jgi:hypothetical protein
MITETENKLLADLTTVIADLHAGGTEDGESMFMLGAGADRLCSFRDTQTWAGFKSALSPADIVAQLRQIEIEGQAAVSAEQGTRAYALQALAFSLAAITARQDITQAGAALLDSVIESALKNYRTHAKPALG